MKHIAWCVMVVGILSNPIAASQVSTSGFYDDYIPLCTLFGGRMSRSNDTTAEQIFSTCHCINDYIENNKIVHEGLRVDLAIGVFANMEYYLRRDNLSVEEQFFHIAEVRNRCPIE